MPSSSYVVAEEIAGAVQFSPRSVGGRPLVRVDGGAARWYTSFAEAQQVCRVYDGPVLFDAQWDAVHGCWDETE